MSGVRRILDLAGDPLWTVQDALGLREGELQRIVGSVDGMRNPKDLARALNLPLDEVEERLANVVVIWPATKVGAIGNPRLGAAFREVGCPRITDVWRHVERKGEASLAAHADVSVAELAEWISKALNHHVNGKSDQSDSGTVERER
jgi:hypothetical protein